MTTTPTTMLAKVLAEHGQECGCEGACGKDHAGGRCRRPQQYGKPPLHAAPYPPYPSDVENAAAPRTELRPWCGPCWAPAIKRERDRRAHLRQRELDTSQIELFEVDRTTA